MACTWHYSARRILKACNYRGKFLVQWEILPPKTEMESYRGRHPMAISGLYTLVPRWAHMHSRVHRRNIALERRQASPFQWKWKGKQKWWAWLCWVWGHIIEGRNTGHLVINHNKCNERHHPLLLNSPSTGGCWVLRKLANRCHWSQDSTLGPMCLTAWA